MDILQSQDIPSDLPTLISEIARSEHINLTDESQSLIARYVRQRIARAVEEERERCAKIAESLYDKTYWDDPVAGIAAQIRKGE